MSKICFLVIAAFAVVVVAQDVREIMKMIEMSKNLPQAISKAASTGKIDDETVEQLKDFADKMVEMGLGFGIKDAEKLTAKIEPLKDAKSPDDVKAIVTDTEFQALMMKLGMAAAKLAMKMG